MPLVNLVFVLIVVGVALWLINRYIPMASSIKSILNVVVVVFVAVWVLQAVGLWGSITSTGSGDKPTVANGGEDRMRSHDRRWPFSRRSRNPCQLVSTSTIMMGRDAEQTRIIQAGSQPQTDTITSIESARRVGSIGQPSPPHCRLGAPWLRLGRASNRCF